MSGARERRSVAIPPTRAAGAEIAMGTTRVGEREELVYPMAVVQTFSGLGINPYFMRHAPITYPAISSNVATVTVCVWAVISSMDGSRHK